jgi:hypothetical protein
VHPKPARPLARGQGVDRVDVDRVEKIMVGSGELRVVSSAASMVIRSTQGRQTDSYLFALTLDFMCCALLEQRKATCNSAQHPKDRPKRIAGRAGRVGRPQPLGKLGVLSLSKRQGPGPTEGTRLASDPFGLRINTNLKSKKY